MKDVTAIAEMAATETPTLFGSDSSSNGVNTRGQQLTICHLDNPHKKEPDSRFKATSMISLHVNPSKEYGASSSSTVYPFGQMMQGFSGTVPKAMGCVVGLLLTNIAEGYL